MNPQYLYSSLPNRASASTSYIGGNPASFDAESGKISNLVSLNAPFDGRERWLDVVFDHDRGAYRCFRGSKKRNGKGTVRSKCEGSATKNAFTSNEVEQPRGNAWDDDDGGWGDDDNDDNDDEGLVQPEPVVAAAVTSTLEQEVNGSEGGAASNQNGHQDHQLAPEPQKMFIEEYVPEISPVKALSSMRKYISTFASDGPDADDDLVRRKIASELERGASSSASAFGELGGEDCDDDGWDDEEDNWGGGGGGKASRGALDKYLATLSEDTRQLIRYGYADKPLYSVDLYSKKNKGGYRPDDVGKCQKCGGRRMFEFQVLPKVVDLLGIHKDDIDISELRERKHVESSADAPPPPPQPPYSSVTKGEDDDRRVFGNLFVYTCEHSCGEEGEEVVVRQPVPMFC